MMETTIGAMSINAYLVRASAIGIWSGKDSIVVLICFQCNEIGVIPDESKPSSLHTQKRHCACATLLKLARQAFPDDKILQSLKDVEPCGGSLIPWRTRRHTARRSRKRVRQGGTY